MGSPRDTAHIVFMEWYVRRTLSLAFSPADGNSAPYVRITRHAAATNPHTRLLLRLTQIVETMSNTPTLLYTKDGYAGGSHSMIATTVGIWTFGALRVDFDHPVEEFIAIAWGDVLKIAWKGLAGRDLDDAFMIIAEMSGSVAMKMAWENEKGRDMNIETVCITLGVSKGTGGHC